MVAINLNPVCLGWEIVDGNGYSVIAQLVFDDLGDDEPAAAGESGAQAWHVHGSIVRDREFTNASEAFAQCVVPDRTFIAVGPDSVLANDVGYA